MNMEQVEAALERYHAGGSVETLRFELQEAGVIDGLAEQAIKRAEGVRRYTPGPLLNIECPCRACQAKREEANEPDNRSG